MRAALARPCLPLLLLALAAGERCTPDHPLTTEQLQQVDVAFVAFFKCGSSSFRKFFQGHPDVELFSNPHQLEFERRRLEAPRRPGARRVIVAETFSRNQALVQCLLRASPRVKLLVLVREPVAWLESLYNFIVWWVVSDFVEVFFLPPFFEVLRGKEFGNSRWDLNSALLYQELRDGLFPLLPPEWRLATWRLTPSRSGFNASSPLLVMDLNSFREPRGLEVIATLRRYMGLRRPFPPDAIAELREPTRGQNVASSRPELHSAHRVRAPSIGARRPRYVDLCSPKMIDNLTSLAILYARERAKLRALLLSPVGSGVPSLSMEQPMEALCRRRPGAFQASSWAR